MHNKEYTNLQPSKLQRNILLLQGPQSPFFKALAKKLTKRQAHVYKIQFCGGDIVSYPNLGSWFFNQPRKNWERYFINKIEHYQITDIVLFGDQRPLHKQAISIAKKRDINIFVFEEGYLQPNFITCEKDGVNGHSPLPKDPEKIAYLSSKLSQKELAPLILSSLSKRVWDTIWHHVGNFILWPIFPFYKTHRPYCIGYELKGWIPRYLTREKRRNKALALQKKLLDDTKPFYLYPLQLNSDFQIRENSPYQTITESLEEVISSFSRYAPMGTKLIIKNHPLDNGLLPYQDLITTISEKYDVIERVLYLDGGDGKALTNKCLAMIVINSTMGLKALIDGKPVYCLGNAIYALPGLAMTREQMELNSFWNKCTLPNSALIKDFIALLHHKALLPGNYYTDEGIQISSRHAASKILYNK